VIDNNRYLRHEAMVFSSSRVFVRIDLIHRIDSNMTQRD